jgi:transposase-like protein
MPIAEAFLKTLVKVYGNHPVYSDGVIWYPQACNFLGLVHILHSPFEKGIIERTIQYFKDRTEGFDTIILACEEIVAAFYTYTIG